MDCSQRVIDAETGLSASRQERDELKGGYDKMRGNELDEKVSWSINSGKPPLCQRFKNSKPVLVTETNIGGRP